MATVVTVLFFLSGLVALAYELVWVRALGLVVGNSLWAAIVVVAAYMGGMAVGSALIARFAARIRRHLRWYAAAEGVAALFALATFTLLTALAPVAARMGPAPLAGWGLALAGRFFVASLFLAVPTVAMGITLPLLVERVASTEDLRRRVARLYAANTAGAMTGVVATAFAGLPLAGERGTISLAACVGLVVATVAGLLENRIPRPTAVPERPRRAWSPWLAWPALFGFVALAAELVWTRILLLHLGSRVYAFALILAVYLLGLSLGSWAARRWHGEPRLGLAVVQGLLALSIAVQLPVLAKFGDILAWLAARLRPEGFFGLEVTLAVGVSLLLLPATAAFGATFPLTVAAAPVPAGDTARTGMVAAANTLGAILGAVCGPLVLVPALGSQASLIALGLAAATAAVAIGRTRATSVLGLGVAASLVAALVLLPRGWVLRGAAQVAEGEVEALSESASATVVVRRLTDARGTWRSLELNGVNVAGTSPGLRAIQRLQGHLPLLLGAAPHSVLHIGFGSGGTAAAVARHAEVSRIVIAEISPEVLDVAGTVFKDVNHGVLHDPRVRVVVNDGRNVLLSTRARFDAILSDSIHPVYAGNSSLYTKEYFELCRRHLNRGGVVSMWLPMYSLSESSYLAILRAFWEVFPNAAVWYDPVVLNEFTVVTGSVEDGPLHLRWWALADPELATTLGEAGASSPELLAGMLLLGPTEVATLVTEVRPHVDDFPEVEYHSGRILNRDAAWLANFRMLYAFRARSDPFASFPGDWRAVAEHRDAAIRVELRALKKRVALEAAQAGPAGQSGGEVSLRP